jgi:hypothetical protein
MDTCRPVGSLDFFLQSKESLILHNPNLGGSLLSTLLIGYTVVAKMYTLILLSLGYIMINDKVLAIHRRVLSSSSSRGTGAL